MSAPQTKADLLERIDGAWAELDRSILALPDGELKRAGKDGWSRKDHLAHLAAWELSVVALLHGADPWAAVGIPAGVEDINVENEILHRRYQELSSTEVRALARGSHQCLLDELARLQDVDLRRPYSDFHPSEERADGGAPVVGWIVGNTYDHVEEHLGWMKAEWISPTQTASRS